MPNTRSAKKRLLTSVKRRSLNRMYTSRVKAAKKEFLSLVDAGNKDAAEVALRKCYATLDKAGKRNALAKNKISRDKSRLTSKLNALA